MNTVSALPIERDLDSAGFRILSGWMSVLSTLTMMSLFVLGAFAAGIICLSLGVTTFMGAILDSPEHPAYIISAIASGILVVVALAAPISSWVIHKV